MCPRCIGSKVPPKTPQRCRILDVKLEGIHSSSRVKINFFIFLPFQSLGPVMVCTRRPFLSISMDVGSARTCQSLGILRSALSSMGNSRLVLKFSRKLLIRFRCSPMLSARISNGRPSMDCLSACIDGNSWTQGGHQLAQKLTSNTLSL